MSKSMTYAVVAIVAVLCILRSTTAQVPVVSMFPVTTQTSFPSPLCTGASAKVIESFNVNYNFETVERGNAVTATTPIGEYNLLNFLGLNWVDTDPDLDGNHLGLAPHTYPDVAAFSAATTDLLSPTASLITANYSESTISSFQPYSLWYGCVAPSPYSAGSLPESCDITAAGYDAAGKQIASQVFVFVANGSVVQDQSFGVFSGWPTDVYTLAFSVSNPLTTAALVDNFIARLFQPACAAFYTGSYNNGT